MLGVHYQTAYRWVRTGTLPAVKVGTGYRLDPGDVERLAAERRRGREATPRPEPDWQPQAGTGELYEAAVNGEEARAELLIGRLHSSGVPTVDLIDELISPVIRRLDETRASGSLPSAQAVLAAGICERIVSSLTGSSRGRPRGLAVVAGPEGEHDPLPSLMATAALRSERWRVHHLGSGVPLADLMDLVRETGPDLVVLAGASDDAETAKVRQELSFVAVPVLITRPGDSLRQLLNAAPPVRRGRSGRDDPPARETRSRP